MTTMTIQRLYRLELLTSAHFGAAAAEAELEGPTQKNTLNGLPFVPGSTIKGVLAGSYGDQNEQKLNTAREDLYGSPDRGGNRSQGFGRASNIVPGDAELLAFPVPLHKGGAGWIFPLSALARALRWRGTDLPLNEEVLGALAHGPVLALPDLPSLDGDVPLTAVTTADASDLRHIEPLLRSLAGETVAGAPLLIVSDHGAARLWQQGADRRARIAVDSQHRTTTEGTLRTVELIPSGAIFLTPVTLHGGVEPPASGLLQMGAWEGSGQGFLWLEPVPDDTEPKAPTKASPVHRTEANGEFLDRAAVWNRAYRDVAALDGRPDRVRASARAAVFKFGPRARLQGFETAVAFAVAKAKAWHHEPKDEAQAHRWFLGALFETGNEVTDWLAEGVCEPLIEWLQARPKLLPAPFEEGGAVRSEQAGTWARWHGLRRFAEALLTEEDAA